MLVLLYWTSPVFRSHHINHIMTQHLFYLLPRYWVEEGSLEGRLDTPDMKMEG